MRTKTPHSPTENHSPRTTRAVILAAAVPLVLLLGGAQAHADDQPSSPIPNVDAARQVLQSSQVHTSVSRFLATTGKPATDQSGSADGGAGPGTAAAEPRFDLKDPVGLYEITPDFVAGKTAATPDSALHLSYLASRVTAGDGHQAAVLLAPQPQTSSWQLAGIRDGDTEVGYAEKATPQARVFTEPQIHAWYRLTQAGTVEPLNPEATTGLSGKPSVSLADYQKLVTARYGDKLPGSDYDRKGLAGGFGLTTGGETPEAAAEVAVQATPQAAAERSDGSSMLPVVGGSVAAAALAGGLVAYLRLRRTY